MIRTGAIRWIGALGASSTMLFATAPVQAQAPLGRPRTQAAPTAQLAQPPDPWSGPPPDASAENPPPQAHTSRPPARPPPTPTPPEVAADEDSSYTSDDYALFMAMVAVRPFGTHVAASDDVATDPSGLVAGHVGLRVHGAGLDDDITIRTDLEGFLGASSEGLEGEGRAFLSFGLATEVSRLHYLMFRFGAGGALLGNELVDYQVADLPALELGYVHTGADGYIEIAPRVAMGLLQMSAFGTGHLEPDPAPAAGGRLLAGGDTLWGTIDYEIVTGARPLQIGAFTACFADKFSICLDGRVASASLAFAGGAKRVTAISGGLSLGVGVAEVEH